MPGEPSRPRLEPLDLVAMRSLQPFHNDSDDGPTSSKAATGRWNNRPVRATVRTLFGACTFKTSSMADQVRFCEPQTRRFVDVHTDKVDRSSAARIWRGHLGFRVLQRSAPTSDRCHRRLKLVQHEFSLFVSDMPHLQDVCPKPNFRESHRWPRLPLDSRQPGRRISLTS